MIKHSIIYFISKFLPAIISILTLSILTNFLEPEEYGLYSLILLIVGLFNIFIFQWLRSSFIRFYNEKKNKLEFFNLIIFIHFMILFICLLIILLAILLIKEEYRTYLFLGYLLLISISFSDLLIIYFRTTLKVKKVLLFSISTSLLTLAVNYYLLINGHSIKMLLAGNFIALIVIIIFFGVTHKEFRNLEFNKQALSDNIKTLFVYGFPVSISFVLSVLMQNIDKIMITTILGLEENGNYSVAFDLMHNTMYMILTSLSLAAFPIVLKTLGSKGMDAASSKFSEYIQLFLFIAFPLTLGLIAISEDVIELVAGEKYSINKSLLIIIIFATLFHALKSYWFDQILQISGRTKVFFIPVLVAIVINIVFNYFLLNKIGLDGAAIATLVGFFIAMLLSYFYGKDSLTIKISLKDLIKLIINSIVMYVCIGFIKLEIIIIELFVKVILGIVIYFLLSYISNVFKIKKLVFNRFKY